MEATLTGKDQNQMLHSLLGAGNAIEVSNEHTNFSTSHFDTNDQSSQQFQHEQQLNLNELQWHPQVASLEGCEETSVQVFSISDSYVWQSSALQEDPVGCLPALETHLDTGSKVVKGVTKELNSVECQPSTSSLKSRKKNGKSKCFGVGPHTKTVSKKKAVRGRTIVKNSLSTMCQESKIWPHSKDPQAAGSKKESSEIVKSTIIEDDASQVRKRFSLGCECQDSNCFDGLNPETVFRHRLNIAELTKEEHDMYLMGLTMACLSDWEHTNRNKERQRLRAKYVHQGRSVCLQAFLYLENCTCYQVKRIRKHVMTHGVVPRIHGNHGKRPHNTFALEIYCHATEFLKLFVRENGGKDFQSKNTPIILGPDVTRKSVHQGYLEYCRKNGADVKVMSYSTFRHFMREQFPQIRFRIVDGPGVPRDGSTKQIQSSGRSQSHLSQLNLEPNQGSASNLSKLPHLNQHDMEVLTFAQVLMSGNQNLVDASQEFRNRHESTLSADGNIVVIDALPLDSANSFLSSAVSNSSASTCSSTNSSKLLTLNSSSLCVVNNSNVSSLNPPALVPMNTFAMLGSSVIPFVVESKESKELLADNE